MPANQLTGSLVPQRSDDMIGAVRLGNCETTLDDFTQTSTAKTGTTTKSREVTRGPRGGKVKWPRGQDPGSNPMSSRTVSLFLFHIWHFHMRFLSVKGSEIL